MNNNLINTLPMNIKEKIILFLEFRPVPIGKIAKEFNINVVVTNLTSNYAGIIDNTKESIKISINKINSRQKQRCSFGILLAYYLLNYNNDNILNQCFLENSLFKIINNKKNIKQDLMFQSYQLASEILIPTNKSLTDLNYLKNNLNTENLKMIESKWEVNNFLLRVKLTYI